MTSANNGIASAQQYVSSSPSSSRKRVGLGVGVCRKCGGQGHNGENARVLKKGPWTAEEDALLIDYVKKHGERHWNCVQKTGLMRCGKSCRLRWTNHLRPDLKKGSFSIEEERIVLDLQAKLGNKWSKIAAQLPGRTDNEVKNFWNTKIKRRMKANLLSINYDGSSIQRPHTFRQVQTMQNQIHGFRQEICSMSDSINTSNNHGFSFNIPNYIPMSLEQNDLRKTNPNLINLTKINDPILSFLNNPAYNKFQLVNEATNFNVKNFPLPFSPIPIQNLSTNSGNLTMYDFPNNSQQNSISLDATSWLASSTCDKVEVPIHNPHLHITPTSNMLSDSYDLNDIWITSTSLGKSIEMEKSTITQEGQCEINNFVDDDGGHMFTVLKGQGTSHMEELDEQSRILSQNEAFKFKKEELDKLVSLDDDLSGLLYNFSNNGSPPPSYHSSDFLSEFIHYKEPSDVSFSLTSLPPALSFQEFDCNFNNNYCNHTKTQ